MSFWQKYEQSTKLHNSYVCVGLDTDKSKLPEILKNEKNPMWTFNKEIIDATKNSTASYKLNYAFYTSAGREGIEALEKTLEYIPSYIPVILDVKVGDIGNTMDQYAKAYFEIMKVDSITANPLMGHDVVKPLLEYEGKFTFLLALTSNPSALDFLKRNDLFRIISKYIAGLDTEKIGAVVGATNSNELREMRAMMPNTLFLIPGIGAQGGNLQEVMSSAITSKKTPNILINSSRCIIFADSTADFAQKAAIKADSLKEEINICL